MPTGVAARCFISTMVPTVPAPDGRRGLRIAPAASSRRPMRKGVARAWTPWFPIACAVRSGPTVVVTSAVAPGSRSMTQTITPERAGTASGPWHHTRHMVRWVAAAGVFVVSLDSMVNISFPAMAAAFGAPPEQVRWVIIGYVGSYAVTSFVAGAAADRIGHLPVFRAGLGLSAAAFALCGWAPSFGLLVAGRAVQGIAGGLVYGTAPALVTLGAAAPLRGRRLGFLHAAIGCGFAAGPLPADGRGARPGGDRARRHEPRGGGDAARPRRSRPLRCRLRARRLSGAEHGERDGRVPRAPPGGRRRAHVPGADARRRHRRRDPCGRLRRTPGDRRLSARVRRGVHALGSPCRRPGRGAWHGLGARALYTPALRPPPG